MDEWTRGLQDEADTLLFGRVCWEGLAEYWPAAEQNPENEAEAQLARYMNGATKFVFSRTLTSTAAWANSTVLGGDIESEIANIRARPGGDIVLLGGAQIAQELISRDLVDVYKLLVAPQLFGGGTPLFGHDGPRLPLRLVENRTIDTGAVLLRYERR